MLLKKKNLLQELISERNKIQKNSDILEEVRRILVQNDQKRDEISEQIKQKSSTSRESSKQSYRAFQIDG